MNIVQSDLYEKQFLQAILNTSINGVIACEAIFNDQGKIADLEIVLINKAFTQILGFTEAEVIGKRYLSVFPSSKINGMFDLNCQVIETGESRTLEYFYKDTNLEGWYQVSISKLGDKGILSTFIDVSEHKRNFIQLEQQKNLLDNILENSANGISVTEIIRNEAGEVIDGRTILANEAAVQFAGVPREIYMTKTATEIEPNIVKSEYFQLCVKTLETGEPQLVRYFIEYSKRWIEVTVSRLDHDHIIAIFTDVTRTQETELQQKQLIEELRRSNESLEDFSYAASHDLKEPIRKIQVFTTLLKERMQDHPNEAERRLLERISNAAERMQLLVDDLLEYSHVSFNPRETEAVDINEKVSLILVDLEMIVKEKNAEITVLPLPVISGYKRQIQQLFQNLISNALKYTKPGQASHIEISSREVKGSDSGINVAANDQEKLFYMINVKDDGIGFDQASAEKIFGLFHRLHGNNEYSGTGIGLAIAKKVVENHHGYIKAESEEGKGATFRLLLPK
ncbi:MAG: ATP-binding protein [Flavisolibacter sp.]